MRAALESHGNPYLGPEYQHENPGGWFNSHGLYQLMAPYHVPKWDWRAPPSVLLNPVISTVIGGRLWNRAAAAGARNLCDVRTFWKFGRLVDDDAAARRCDDTMARLESLGYPGDLALRPLEAWGLEGFGTGPEPDDAERLADALDELGLPADGSIGQEWAAGELPDDELPDELPDDIDPIPDAGETTPPGIEAPPGALALVALGLAFLALRR
jgi:hypothetical protein